MPTRPPASGGGDPPAAELERRRRRRDVGLSLAALATFVAVIAVERRIASLPEPIPFADSLPFLFLNALSVVLIALLVYLSGRQLVKLWFERRMGALGAHLNLKFVLALFLVAAVPMAIQYWVASSLITTSINAWFGLQMDRAIDDSAEVADAYYDAWTQRALHYGRQISAQITAERMLREGQRDALVALVHEKQREYALGVIQIFPYAEQEPIATLVNPEIPEAAFLKRESALVDGALQGHERTLVEPTGSETGDVIRAAVPIRSSDPARPQQVVGVVVVNHLVPHALAYKVGQIRDAVAEYRRVKPLTGHIAGVYQLVLLLFSLVTVLFALWWGLRMAKGVTGPIRALAEGTAKVAKGDLDVVIAETSDDEIGFLVRSFNRMTRDLREARTRIDVSSAELERRRGTMEIVLRNVDAGLVSLDAEGRVTTINRAAERLLGVPSALAPLGKKLEEVVQRPELLATLRELEARAQPGSRESVRRQTLAASGAETQTLSVTLSRMHDEEGRPLGSVVVVDDYTREVRAQRMAAWREVARRIAHEVKNPLTPIQLSAQRLRRRFRERVAGEGEDARVFDECVDTITSQVESMKVLVDEFSQFARLPAVNPRPGDLDALVQEAIASYADAPGVRFETRLDGTLPRVDFDREQLRRVLGNLIKNACDSVRDSGREGVVSVGTVHDAEVQTVRIEVADNGVGIAEQDRRHIFEPYFSTKSHGTGLGLAIVARIVADHHGYVRAHANRPHGARFVVELPVRYA